MSSTDVKLHADAAALPVDVQQTLLRRAERLRVAPADAQAEERVVWVAAFTLGEDRIAFPLAALRGVTPLRLVTPVPLAAPHVIGIVRFHGDIVTVISLATLLGRAWQRDPSVLVVVEREGGQILAFDCDDVPAAIAMNLDAVRAAREGVQGPLVAVVDTGGLPLLLLDIERLIPRAPQELVG